jgi:RNA polymerase sigma-70 factor (ECF subfamily)
MKAMEHINTFREGSFSSWMYRIARNTVIDYYRTSKNIDPLERAQTSMVSDDPEGQVDAQAALSKVREQLAKLKPEHREVVLLRLWDDLPYERIAEITGKSETNCKVIFSRSVKAIREQLAVTILFFILFIHTLHL